MEVVSTADVKSLAINTCSLHGDNIEIGQWRSNLALEIQTIRAKLKFLFVSIFFILFLFYGERSKHNLLEMYSLVIVQLSSFSYCNRELYSCLHPLFFKLVS
jgi:hypothetical protein